MIAEPTAWQNLAASVAGIFAKETRWRMRGRRAFVIMTVYLICLGLLVLFVYQSAYDAAARSSDAFNPFDPFMTPARLDAVSAAASAGIGQAIFTTILIVQTLLTLLLAPALTSGAISMEREKQTLELLITTPVSTLGLVVGKLVSSLAFVFLLVLASLPLMSLVFVFGGIAPDDIIRAYVLLFALAFGVGSIGLFMSALVKRTQLATALSYLIVFGLTVVALIVHTWMLAASRFDEFMGETTRGNPPAALVLLSPFPADLDILCTAMPDTYEVTCAYVTALTGAILEPTDLPRDSFWPQTVIAYVATGIALTLLTTQLISPSRSLRRRRQPAAPAAPAPPEPPEMPGLDGAASTP